MVRAPHLSLSRKQRFVREKEISTTVREWGGEGTRLWVSLEDGQSATSVRFLRHRPEEICPIQPINLQVLLLLLDVLLLMGFAGALAEAVRGGWGGWGEGGRGRAEGGDVVQRFGGGWEAGGSRRGVFEA